MLTRWQVFVIFLYLVLKYLAIFNATESTITFVDVGQGDSILIEHADYKVMVDGGPDYSAVMELSSRFTFNFCKLDIVFLTHPHADHLAGLNRVLKWCDVGSVVYHDYDYDSKVYEKFLSITGGKNVLSLTAGEEIIIEDIILHVLWPSKSFIEKEQKNINLTSYVLLLDHFESEILLTGDAEKVVLDQLANHPKLNLIDGRLEIFKVPHQGAFDSLSPDFVKRINPENCVISVGENKFGHPHEDVINYLESVKCSIYITEEDGSFKFIML
jgi:competence protein ComEC